MSKKVFCRDLYDKKHEVDSDQLIFRPSVYGVLVEDGKVLLSKQHQDGYDFPGGGVDPDETIHDALKREFFEETGIKVEVEDVIHCETSFFNPSHSEKYKDQYWNCPLIYYAVKKVGGDLSIENFDEEEKIYAEMPEWIELEKIDDIKFYNGVDSPELIRKTSKRIEG